MKNKLSQSERYSLFLRLVHWTVALLIFVNLGLGVYMTPYVEGRPILDTLYDYHKSIGVTVFVLVWLRLGSRLAKPVPALPATLPVMDRLMARVAHVLLYILMFVVPVLGYLMSSTYEYSSGVPVFGLFDVPELLEKDQRLYEIFNAAHGFAAYLLLTVVGLHVAGAIKHRFFDTDKRNDVLKRML